MSVDANSSLCSGESWKNSEAASNAPAMTDLLTPWFTTCQSSTQRADQRTSVGMIDRVTDKQHTAARTDLEAPLLTARPRNVLDGEHPRGRVLAEPGKIDDRQPPRRGRGRGRQHPLHLARRGSW